ncbi:cyclophilin-like peptidyl-prolyl cis-trans isomerase family protein [Wolffia australiana]
MGCSAAAPLLSPPPPPRRSSANSLSLHRRELLSMATASLSLLPGPAQAQTQPQPLVTDRVFLDFSLCPSHSRSDRTIGSADPGSCPDPVPLGRVVFGLFGLEVPITVANFKSTVLSGAYRGATVHKVLPGEYFAAGRQGRRERGEVRAPPGLASNTETFSPAAFNLGHRRPGTLSLCLTENDDYDEIRLNPSYRNVEFLVTTGPGPCPRLDGQNIVFGTVLEGMDVVTGIGSIPTYMPTERIRQFNDLAEFLGDDRAQNARAMWNRPLKTVFISGCGELQVAKPSLSPSLP